MIKIPYKSWESVCNAFDQANHKSIEDGKATLVFIMWLQEQFKPEPTIDVKLQQFYKIITEWLLPLGYVEIFSNHPCLPIREFHFTKQGIRVICINDYEWYCYLYADILLQPYSLGLKTCRYSIGTDKLQELHQMMLQNIEKLTNKRKFELRLFNKKIF
jgi:hypothetical protein